MLMTKFTLTTLIVVDVVALQIAAPHLTDWNPLVSAGSALLVALALAVPGVLAYLTARRMEVAAAAAAAKAATDAKLATQQNETIIAKADVIVADAAVIKGHVNSEKTAAEGREATLKVENALLREMLADKKATAALLAAQVTATTLAKAITPSNAEQVEASPAVKSLKEIDKHTAAIEVNTASVEDKVDALKGKN